jgi:hypothetical protein
MLFYRGILAFAAITMSAAAILALPGFSPAVEASAPPAVQKSDRLDNRPIGTACSERAWPYYEPNCLRDRDGQTRTVRLIKVDRVK